MAEDTAETMERTEVVPGRVTGVRQSLVPRQTRYAAPT